MGDNLLGTILHMVLIQPQCKAGNAAKWMMMKMWTGRGVKFVRTQMVSQLSAVGNVVRVREKRMEKVRRERDVKLVTTIRVRRSRVGNVVGKRERRMTNMKIAETERGVKFVTTKWEKRRRAEGNASLPAIVKIMPTVIGNVAMPAMLVMTMRILLNVESVLDRDF